MEPTRNLLSYGINGSLRRRDNPQQSVTEYYLHNSSGNLKAYSNSGWNFAYYGYDAANARTYKLSMLNLTQWVNGQPQPLQLQLQNAMFYPNAYLTFNANGEYTKHYYNGSERICSRLGDRTLSLDCSASLTPQTQQRLGTRIMKVDQRARAELLEVVEAGDIPIETPSVDITSLQSANPNANSHSHSNTSNDIFYYHTNHLGSTAFVTDNNATVTQGFLYAPFGEITTEYNVGFANGVIPKYSFNAKELDEETGMYYYEARYYNPPVFVSRDAMFEKYFWMTPYAYCANNPVKYVDPSGNIIINTHYTAYIKAKQDFENARIEKKHAKKVGDKASIEKAKENFRTAKRDYKDAFRIYNYAQNAIDDFKSKMPNEYDKLNSLKDQNGNAVNVNVEVKYGYSKYFGQTYIKTQSDGTVTGGVISIFLYADMIEQYYSVSSGQTFAHEGGHGFYEVSKSLDYYNYCKQQEKDNSPVTDGHNPGNLSGESANEWEKKYLESSN